MRHLNFSDVSKHVIIQTAAEGAERNHQTSTEATHKQEPEKTMKKLI